MKLINEPTVILTLEFLCKFLKSQWVLYLQHRKAMENSISVVRVTGEQ